MKCVPAFAALLLSGVAFAAQGSFDRTLQVSGPVDLQVSTGSGHIHVAPGSANQVQVHATIHANEGVANWFGGGGRLSPQEKVQRLQQNPPIEQTGNNIRIGRIEDQDLRNNVSIDYDVTVPPATRLSTSSGSGDQDIRGIEGPVDTRTGSGNLTVGSIGGEVHASSGSGEITVNDAKGGMRASTGSGEIRGNGIAGSIEASTGSGDIRLRQSAAGSVHVRTGSGTVELEGVDGSLAVSTGSGDIRANGKPAADWRIDTGSGTVTVNLPQQAGYEVYARTSSGRISVDAPMTSQSFANRGRELRATVRGGGHMLDLHTSSGDIRVR
ncbi:MAG: DUF4097 family beta strand repeat protein [Acidobacteria bacterium]|nr:DUF4097 family beta strand repeat protein [Acidobacteriota bacterium]